MSGEWKADDGVRGAGGDETRQRQLRSGNLQGGCGGRRRVMPSGEAQDAETGGQEGDGAEEEIHFGLNDLSTATECVWVTLGRMLTRGGQVFPQRYQTVWDKPRLPALELSSEQALRNPAFALGSRRASSQLRPGRQAVGGRSPAQV